MFSELRHLLIDYMTLDEFQVTTKDGYILSLQRIPAGRSGKKSNKPPVLLQHGILIDAAAWLLNSPDESLAFILADEGFDVWLANTRGTQYSSGHTSLSPNDPAYWDWSWDELSAYDLPAFFEYVHDQTGQDLHYVGHSLGTLMALATFSQENLLNMLRSAAMLCPIAYLGQIPTELARAAADSFLAEDLYWLGLHEFLPGGNTKTLSVTKIDLISLRVNREAVANLVGEICNKTHSNCSDLMVALTGQACCVNSSTIDVFLQHALQPTATRNLIHLAQMIRKGTIAMYDYGNEDDNNKHYGQRTPPAYDMASIPKDLPLFMGYGGQDLLADVKDVQTLLDTLKNHDADKLVTVFREEYAHADFVFGVNANQVVYDPLMAFFKLH
ncbi:hypothetical protein TEA_023123 [Camellia sinensis var. sinensis]|uniref:Lipase n=1 Tax=Camellia sinensis var. sinensis TaxID=542762 RepID=A0A4V6RYG1_CAMSN|nr:hypothetical protein TEA_023123 [Camellia sinensis var. sinensis]